MSGDTSRSPAILELSIPEYTRLANQLQRVQWGMASSDEKGDLFDELAERFGHNSLAESLKAFGL